MTSSLPSSGSLLFDIGLVREHFPALSLPGPDQLPIAYFDGPAGTQVPSECIRAIHDYLIASVSNAHGASFEGHPALMRTSALAKELRREIGLFLGAADADSCVLGPSATALTVSMSRSLAPTFKSGDEIVLSRLDHDANVAPWLSVAKERGMVVRWIEVDPDVCVIDYAAVERVVTRRTRLIALGLASNAVGSLVRTDEINGISSLAKRTGALLWIDAVHAAPHLVIDVSRLGADFVVCSAYKFFGPHLAILWARPEVLRQLVDFNIRSPKSATPDRFEYGTPPYELYAGLMGTFAYFKWLGGAAIGPGSSARVNPYHAALEAIRAYEQRLAATLLEGLLSIPKLRLFGSRDPTDAMVRCPTFGFVLDGVAPQAVAASLARKGIAVWAGQCAAYELMTVLGRSKQGGILRVGIVHYNTPDEIARLVSALGSFDARGS